MTETIRTAEELREALNQLTTTYDVRFAGKPRATRHIEEMDDLIARLEAFVAELEGAPDEDVFNTMRDESTEALALYRDERENIARVQSEGTPAVEAAMLATYANFVFDEYHRHFAGHSRATRDLGRLNEMMAELEDIEERMDDLLSANDLPAVAEDLKAVRSNLDMYRNELVAIANARDSGTRDDQASNLATAANEQFKIYQSQFAGRGRTTRRPELLDRMIANLNEILDRMRKLSSKGYRNQVNTKNITIVQENLKLYKKEVREIREARLGTTQEDRAGMLGGAANDLMDEYRANFAGQDRRTRDLEVLAALCDGMYEIALQMREIQDEQPGLEMNNKNLSIVIDNLVLYHAEYRNIQEAKGR